MTELFSAAFGASTVACVRQNRLTGDWLWKLFIVSGPRPIARRLRPLCLNIEKLPASAAFPGNAAAAWQLPLLHRHGVRARARANLFLEVVPVFARVQHLLPAVAAE